MPSFYAIAPSLMRKSQKTIIMSAYRMASSIGNEKKSSHFKILIAGGGSGGCAVAAKLKSTFKPGEIAIVEPTTKHYYQAAWTLVGAGIMDLEKTAIPMEEAIPKHVKWIRDSLTGFDPKHNRVVMASGNEITYDYLIISLGFQLRFEMLKGSIEALKNDPRVCTNYAAEYVEKTYKAIQAFKTGDAIFTIPKTPIKCAGAPLKIMFLFEDYLKKNNRLSGANIRYFGGTPTIFRAPKYAKSLDSICEKRAIETHMNHNLIEIDHKKSTVIVEDLNTKKQLYIKYDFLHFCPPMTTPDVLQRAPDGLVNASQYVDVDVETTRHTKFGNIFSLGDCSSLPTSKTAAAIASQTSVLCDNLQDVINGGSGDKHKYDGYTSCPLITGYNKGLMCEFDYELQPLETLPFDQSKERFVFAFTKKNILPFIYWKGLLTGWWNGPKGLRKLFHLGMGK